MASEVNPLHLIYEKKDKKNPKKQKISKQYLFEMVAMVKHGFLKPYKAHVRASDLGQVFHIPCRPRS